MRTLAMVVTTTIVACVAQTGCSSGSSPTPSSGVSGGSGGVGAAIPQPLVPPGVSLAPDSARVDLTVPRFSNPTEVTNPFFPVSRQASVVFVGHVDGKPFRTEVTLLPDTRVIDWGGQRIETLVSQYAAYLGGRLQEVAYDLYAQADDGSVWYFGEDVADLGHGVIATKEGTWLAGKDGQAQMIMPGEPTPGDVYRTENIPGIAFEQVTVKSMDRQLVGPFGPVTGLIGRELHEDGSTELKQFASGYGEYYTGDGEDVEALALAVPTDNADAPMPSGLRRLYADAVDVVHHGPSSGTVGRLRADWASIPRSDVPRRMIPVTARAVDDVAHAHSPREARQAAVNLALRALDQQLRYREPVEVDRDRVALWCDQLLLDAAARDTANVSGDVFTLFYLRDRVVSSLTPAQTSAYNHQLGALQVAAPDHNLGQAVQAARALRDTLTH